MLVYESDGVTVANKWERWYPGCGWLWDLKSKLMDYAPHFIEVKVKDKRLDKIKLAYTGAFDLQYEVIGALKDLEMSHQLAMNEVILPVLEEEYIVLIRKVKELHLAYKKLNQYSELKEPLRETLDYSKVSALMDMMYKGIEYYIKPFQVEHDMKAVKERVKEATK